MMLKYELKKILNKQLNRILLTVALLLMVVFSIFAIGSFRDVELDGDDKNRWQGELTPEVIGEAVESNQAGDSLSTLDIIFSTSKMLVGEFSDLDDYEAILSADSEQIASIYNTYRNNQRIMSKEYGFFIRV